MSQNQILKLRAQLQDKIKELDEVMSENQMYKNYIENLLDYNNKLVNIIEKQLKINTKIDSNLQPISERTQNDSQMVSENKSVVSMGGMRVLGEATNDKSKYNAPQNKKENYRVQNEESQQITVYREIEDLMQKYHNTYIVRKDFYQNEFQEIIKNIEDDKQKFNDLYKQNMEILEIKENELKTLLAQVRSLDGSRIINKISQKNKKIAGDVQNFFQKEMKKKK